MRRHRILKPGASYRVSIHVNRDEALLDPVQEKVFFLMVVERAKKKYPFSLTTFSIMNTYVLFLIRPEKGASLSRIMQWILSVYARDWNKRHNTSGHFWGERFVSRVLEEVKEILETVGEIERRAVKEGLVKLPREWEYGGLWQRINRGMFCELLL